MSSNYFQMQITAKRIVEGKEARIKDNVISDPAVAELTSEALIDKIVSEITLDLIGEFHRAIKLGYGEYICAEFDGGSENASPNSKRAFEEEEKKSEDIKCPNCTRVISASRFAPHLEKCMRMGRNSSRIASRRIANNSKESGYGGMMSDDDDDDDWNAITDKIKGGKKFEPRKKKDKPRKQKSLRAVKEDCADNDEGIALSKLMAMAAEDRVTFLSTTCAVKNETTGKLCVRSMRCSQHTDEERMLARKLIPIESTNGEGYVDIEEVETSSKNETEHSSTSSPADSTSTSSSSSTKKKEKYKQKNVKTKNTSELYIRE